MHAVIRNEMYGAKLEIGTGYFIRFFSMTTMDLSKEINVNTYSEIHICGIHSFE